MNSMKKILLSLSLLILFSTSQMAQAVVIPFSPQGVGLHSTQNGRKMAYDYKQGKQNPVWVFIHGLGDDMSKLQALAALADKDGFGILRVDLQGHGQTLKALIKDQKELPEKLDYQDNIEDIQEIIRFLKITDVVIVGHSYGGGISFGLAAELKKTRAAKVHSVHMLAPYVQRIDKFLSVYFRSSSFVVDSAEQAITKSGVPEEVVKAYWNPFFVWVQAVSSLPRLIREQAKRSLHTQEAKDQILDPILDQAMAQSYRKYFVAQLKKAETDLSEQEKADIDLKVEAAIRVTKGIRAFDLLDLSVPVPEVGAPVQVIGGEKDSLVLPVQLKQFERRLELEKVPHLVEFIDGPKSTHLFPQKMAKEVYKKIQGYRQALSAGASATPEARAP